jgi:phosphohistidine phosphatase
MTTAHTLVVLRHGKSDWSGGKPDLDRPLADRGRRQVPRAGRWLATRLPRIDLAVVSPAARARATWELVAAELDTPPEVTVDERVYAASGDALVRLVRGWPDDLHHVVLVGHNPGLEDLVETFARRWVPLPTSALAVLEISGPWSAAGPDSAELTMSGRPPS